MDLDALAAGFGNPESQTALSGLARRLGLPQSDWADVAAIDGLFRDERLSSRALALHRGRNVYSNTKLELWNRLWVPFRDALVISEETLALTRQLVAFRTHSGGADVPACVALISQRLAALDFVVTCVEVDGHAPLLIARRSARGLRGHLVLYGHYDTEAPAPAAWQSDPWEATERDGRLFGVGVGDNKAALAQRLVWLSVRKTAPAITWVIQGEEEVGSPLAHARLGEMLIPERQSATLWLDENGYFDEDGTQRMLARTIGAAPDESAPADADLLDLVRALGRHTADIGLGQRIECRGLNKNFFPTGCPFNRAIPSGARSLAIGVNDPASRIHRPDESVPLWTFPVHQRQLDTVLDWVDAVADSQ